ncbi:putative molybdenum carrier protein [Methylolobus aquaticus]
MLSKIISGGQTGVDRAALDAAMASFFPCGGWCPAGRQAEDGKLPERYPLTHLDGGGYAERTRRNLLEADGTAVIYFGQLAGGTELTVYLCIQHGRPYQLIDGDEVAVDRAIRLLRRFVEERRIGVLNVAGPRASTRPQAYAYTRAVITSLIARCADSP